MEKKRRKTNKRIFTAHNVWFGIIYVDNSHLITTIVNTPKTEALEHIQIHFCILSFFRQQLRTWELEISDIDLTSCPHHS